MNRRNMWMKINKCIVCGETLGFRPSILRMALPEEGTKFCAHNHAEFSIYGAFDENNQWQLEFRLPK